jgi:putative flavoprotein involved in K+ transport
VVGRDGLVTRDWHFGTIVVGGSQSGLAAGYYLSQLGRDFLILDAGRRVGEAWRMRWDSLRLFTPAKFSALPGLPVAAPGFHFMTKDETADYLEAYVDRFTLPVTLGTRVDSLSRCGARYLLTAGAERFSADQVVVATGAFQTPCLPSFAAELDPSIVQFHSSAYRNPGQLPPGPVLVVGAGNSGAEIALELREAGHRVSLSGRHTGQIPADLVGPLFGGKPYWWILSRLLSVDTPVGRRIQPKALRQGAPLIRLNPKALLRAGVTRVSRTDGVRAGRPRLADGRTLDVTAVVWATGFRPSFDWIRLPVIDTSGHPIHERGVVPAAPGLYFVGLHFQSALTSALLGGVGTDARLVVEQIRERKVPWSSA